MTLTIAFENQNSSTLPTEILDHIFSYLQNDPETLRSIDDVCLETHSRFLRGILDRHLYAHIVVTNFISTRPGSFFCTQLFKYLTSNPHVSKYICTLQLEIGMSSPVQWHDPMSSILRMLQSTLKGIALSSRSSPSLSSDGSSSTMLKWSNLNKVFRNAFLDCLRSSSLTEASIDCIDGLPLSIFNDCTMQSISLRRVIVSYSPLPQFPPETVSLTIHRPYEPESAIYIRDWAQRGQNLRSLNFSSKSQIFFSRFLEGLSAESLTDLCLDFGTSFMRPCLPPRTKRTIIRPLNLSISHLPNLTKLTIWASILLDSWIMSAIPSIAQVAATSSSLQRLILRVRFDPNCVSGVANPKIWEPLVPLAARPSLEHIELGVLQPSKRRRVISKLLGVYQLKKMHNEGFLSLKDVDE